MGQQDAFVPRAVYVDSNLLSCKNVKYSQILEELFWSCFKDYSISLDLKKCLKDTSGLKESDVVIVMDPKLLQGLWPRGAQYIR